MYDGWGNTQFLPKDWIYKMLMAGETLNSFLLAGLSKYEEVFHWEQRSSRIYWKTLTDFDDFLCRASLPIQENLVKTLSYALVGAPQIPNYLTLKLI